MKSRFKKNNHRNKPSILLPVENQVRELDAKILLACIAAQRGFVTVLGPRQLLEFHVNSFKKSVYISKSLKSGNGRYFKILRKFGHEIAAWDEEALVHIPADVYFSRRFSSKALKHVSRLLAWGQDSADLWRQCPDYNHTVPIHTTGNPRGDLLRPEIRPYYDEVRKEIQGRYGDFILINTNFNVVNAFYAVQNLLQPVKHPDEEPELGRTAQNMSREDAREFYDHKQTIFKEFQLLIPKLEQAFPDYTIIIRPHPGENQKIYHGIAADCRRVRVTNAGNVVPWIMAAKVMIHNGCTTGVEAYQLGVPAISYRPAVNEYWDDAYHRLPNQLSYQCYSLEELKTTLTKILNNGLGPPDDRECKQLIDHHLAAQKGAFACERIVSVLREMADSHAETSKGDLADKIAGLYLLIRRRLLKRYRSLLSKSHKTPELLRHNYPGISIDALQERISRFQQVLDHDDELGIDQIYKQIYRISRRF